MDTQKIPSEVERKIRMKLIIAFDGDVPKAEIALKFINGNPDASEEYTHFQQWEIEKYREYCRGWKRRVSLTPSGTRDLTPRA